MAKLIIFSGTPQACEFELKPGANRIGRGDTNDFQITDPSVSTHHAHIIVEGASVVIKDLNSTNGTFINNAPASEGVLQPGKLLRLGGVEVVFHADAPAVAPATEPAPVVAAAARVPVIRVDISSPPPAPVGGGLRFAGSHSAAATPPPVMEQPDDVPAAAVIGSTVFTEPPPGKTACKFHPKIGGQWMCRKCNELFCSLCVSTKPSGEGTIHSCRKCGSDCVPVKTKMVASKEKQVVVYSDKMLLVRSLGFGVGAALLGALIWTGLSYLMGVDVPFLFAPMVGALCGYAVKLGCQDTPSPVFSVIAVVCCIIGSVLGKLGMIAVTHLTINTNTTYFTGGLGILIAIYAAWKIGGDS
jgi:hypothetical protein